MKKFLLTYFSFCFFFFTFFASGFVESQDGQQYLAIARRIYYDKTLEMPEEAYPTENIYMAIRIGKDSKRYSLTGLGYTLALLPSVFAEDMFLRITDKESLSAFPLQSDWPVHLFASFTNAFFGAILANVIYLYLRSFNIKHKTALYLSFISIISANLWPYTKHSFAHIMFASFLTLTFYLIRISKLEMNSKYLYFAGVSYGIVVISYNPTFLFALPALVIYYFSSFNINIRKLPFKSIIKDLAYVTLGILPFLFIYYTFNRYRFGSGIYSGYGGTLVPEAYVFVEGIWNVLLSPGRSFILYSPLLIILIVFWFKLKKELLPETIAFAVLSSTYIILIGTFVGGTDYLVWHGESSWGPRYMTPIIPLAMILVGNIFTKLTKKEKLLVFYPLMAIGIYIQVLGILFPYQIKFAGLQMDAFFNGRNFNMYEYGNEIPRYSPIFKMTKTLAKRTLNINQQFNHGKYNLRLYDGFYLPFETGVGIWREIMPSAKISFDNNNVETVNFLISNHLINSESTHAARLNISVNGTETISDFKIDPGKEEVIELDLSGVEKNNVYNLDINYQFEGTSLSRLKNEHVLFLKDLKINGETQNISTIDFPYVSPVSQSLLGIEYGYWGGEQSDPWELWHLRSGVYEKTFDFWWLRPYHYWDLPYKLFIVLLFTNIIFLIYFGIKLTNHESLN